MKKLNIALLLIVMMCASFLVGCNSNKGIVRIHIRANSNSEVDQNIKLSVRDGVVDYITPLLAQCDNGEEVKIVLNQNLNTIECIADKILIDNGFEYSSNVGIRNEYFPSRRYSGEVYPADYYDALILELGSGTGDNWWCVAYPPLCFVGEGSGEVQYRSKLLDMISKFLGR